MSAKPAYRVGIDLGTTNCVVSYVAIDEPIENSVQGESSLAPTLLSIPQVMENCSVQEFTYLPSAIYLLAKDEVGDRTPVLPWREQNSDIIVGVGALALGQRRAGQLVQSAKSWLSHNQVDRRAAILPWGSDFPKKVSPLNAITYLLSHIKQSWNNYFPDHALEDQEIALTLPASFNEEARSLTLEAAQQAELGSPYLLEEPQAACYYYISDDQKLTALADKKMLLVVDIGGGTSDFSLVAIHSTANSSTTNTSVSPIALKRVAVGEHLLLGGDNLDQALAYQLDPRKTSALSASRLAALVQQTRKAKEALLSTDAPESLDITVLGGGSKLIGGSQKFNVSRETLIEQVASGFFPLVDVNEPVQKHHYAMHTLGLPYESDPAFSRHLAAFLSQHQDLIISATGTPIPDAVLFNGGLFNSSFLKSKIVNQLNAWSKAPIYDCTADEPNDAVAKGAVIYLNSLAGQSVRIESGVPHSLYLQLDDDKYIGLLPKGTLKDEAIRLEREFTLKLGQQVQFPLYRSDDAIECIAGEIKQGVKFHYISNLTSELDSSEELNEVQVNLIAKMTEVGVLEVSLHSTQSSESWLLSFATQKDETDVSAEQETVSVLHTNMGQAEELLMRCFSNVGQKAFPDLIKSFKQELDALLGNREEWSLATLRRLADKLLSLKSGRTKSAQHERQWLQLLGFCLRPGYGDSHDPERLQQVINVTQAGNQFDTAAVWGQYWTLYRRVAGGLTVEQQARLYKQFSQYYSPAGQRSREKMKSLETKSSDDLVRLVGSLEVMSLDDKLTTIEWLLKRLKKSSESETSWWAVGRIASRHLLNAERDQRIPEERLYDILDFALKEDWKKRKQAGFAAVLISQMSDGESDKLKSYRLKVAKKLKKDKCPNQWLSRLQSEVEINKEELNSLLGESLPMGLSI
ncbi:hsp70 family protein [Marinomonas sp. C2222]|uniref:Hsp70 family protein n=1 Tax=Marinomonas sargassi TaxID=2984494 RepID=A0ABT2YSH4_9GAMM|nr:hsp70 family protein [Marinomonas sargassi]MCV2402826.1 hsp70 family protein [Marinomonas sargassi]